MMAAKNFSFLNQKMIVSHGQPYTELSSLFANYLETRQYKKQLSPNVYHIMQLLGHTQIKTAQKYIDKQAQERGKKNKELMGRLSAKGGLLG